MKNNFFLLAKVNILAAFDLRTAKKNKAKSISLITSIAILLLIFAAMSAFMTYIYDKSYVEYNIDLIYTTLYFAGLASMLNFTTSVMAVKNVYAGKDYEMLKSMPIRKRDIVSSKIVSLYVVELAYAFTLLIPNGIVNFIFSKDISYLLFNLITIILTPALPIFLATFVATLISFISDRYKFGNLIATFLYVLAFAAIFVISFLMGYGDNKTSVNVGSIMMWFNPTLYFVEVAFTESLFNYLIFVGINVGILIVTVLILALAYDYIHLLITSIKNNNKYERKELKNKTEFKTLLSLELKKISKSKLLFITSILGGLVCLFTTGILIYTSLQLKNGDNAYLVHDYFYVAGLGIMFSIGMSVPASFLISAEGKYFWMMKSMPINYKKMINVKLLTSIIFTLPFVLIATTVLSIVIGSSFINILMLFLICISFCLLTNVLGLRLNLAFPKFKWVNEQEITKNSGSIFASVFGDMGLVIVFSGTMIGLSFINPILATTVTLGLIIIPLLFLYYRLMSRCQRIIESYENF